MLHKTTKKAFDELGLKKLPTIKSLQAEYAVLLAEKKKGYEQLLTAREKMRALTVYRENLRRILALPEHPVPKKKEHGRSEILPCSYISAVRCVAIGFSDVYVL